MTEELNPMPGSEEDKLVFKEWAKFHGLIIRQKRGSFINGVTQWAWMAWIARGNFE